MLFSLLKHHFDLNITDTALKVSRSLYCCTTSISHGVENYFPRLWGTSVSDAILNNLLFHQIENTVKFTFCLQSDTATTTALVTPHLHPDGSFVLAKTFF